MWVPSLIKVQDNSVSGTTRTIEYQPLYLCGCSYEIRTTLGNLPRNLVHLCCGLLNPPSPRRKEFDRS